MRGLSSTETATTSSGGSALATSSNKIMNYSSSSATTSGGASIAGQRLDWESLRKQARQLENEIDSKLVAYSKLCSNYAASSYTSKAPVGSGTSSSSELLFVTLSNELDDALKKLTAINGKMSDAINGDAFQQSVATVHTLQRHRDILRDYSLEYEKTKRNILSYKEREKLLSSSTPTPSSPLRGSGESNLNNRGGSGSNNDSSTSLYLKEYDHLKSSHNLIDQQIELAEMTKENILSQKQSLRLIQQKMNSLAHKFPMINSLMQRVKFKKRKDSIILAIVIAFCIIIFLLYLF